MLKYVFLLYFPFLLYLAPDTYGEIVEEILFKVNEDIITKMDFEDQAKVLKQTYIFQSQKIPYNFEATILSNMIIDILIKQETLRQGINVTDLDVSNHLNSLVQINNLGSLDKLKSYIISQGMTWQYFFNNQKMNMYRENLLSRVVTVREPTPEELFAYYEENKDREFKIASHLPRVAVIYLRKDASMTYSEILKLEARGKQLVKELKAGADFSELAKKHSDDFNSKNVGGDTGWRVKEEFTQKPELWEAIRGLEMGENTSLLSSTDGFYLFKLIDEKKSGHIPFERARKDIQQKLIQLKRQQAYESKLKEIIRGAVIKRQTDRFGDFSLK